MGIRGGWGPAAARAVEVSARLAVCGNSIKDPGSSTQLLSCDSSCVEEQLVLIDLALIWFRLEFFVDLRLALEEFFGAFQAWQIRQSLEIRLHKRILGGWRGLCRRRYLGRLRTGLLLDRFISNRSFQCSLPTHCLLTFQHSLSASRKHSQPGRLSFLRRRVIWNEEY